MTEKNRQYDDDPGLAVSPRFANDLGEVFGPRQTVPAHVDRAVAEAARRHFAHRRRRLWLTRWAVPATAAAAVMVVASLLLVGRGPSPRVDGTRYSQASKDSFPVSEALEASAAPADIDRNGRVNILDAFKLARHIESGSQIDKMWDINGDGLVNNDDVDKVAFAAVRLNKGV